jgi:hypothetical protein
MEFICYKNSMGMLGCKPINIPFDRKCKLRVVLGIKIANVNMYRSMVGVRDKQIGKSTIWLKQL